MLGLGRALGETIAVALLLPQVPAGHRQDPAERRRHRLGLHRPPGRRRRLHRVGSHGRRPRAVRHHARHQHDRVGRRVAQPLGRGGRAVTDGASIATAGGRRPRRSPCDDGAERRPAHRRRRAGAPSARRGGPASSPPTDLVHHGRLRRQRAVPQLAGLRPAHRRRRLVRLRSSAPTSRFLVLLRGRHRPTASGRLVAADRVVTVLVIVGGAFVLARPAGVARRLRRRQGPPRAAADVLRPRPARHHAGHARPPPAVAPTRSSARSSRSAWRCCGRCRSGWPPRCSSTSRAASGAARCGSSSTP